MMCGEDSAELWLAASGLLFYTDIIKLYHKK